MSISHDQRPTILLLGTGHWSNPGRDYHSPEYDDMLAPRRQREIESCLEQLARFQPTKVAIETMADATDELNDAYQRYRSGRLTLTANERDQIGFRLAALLDHERIHGIDWHDRHRDIGWDTAIAFAQDHSQQQLITGFTGGEAEREADRGEDDAAQRPLLPSSTVRELLLSASDPTGLADNHRVYMDLAQVGVGDDYVGADVVLRWYERNLKIFVNLAWLMEAPNDRVLVLIGGGHLPLLTHFIEGAKRFRLVPATAYLA